MPSRNKALRRAGLLALLVTLGGCQEHFAHQEHLARRDTVAFHAGDAIARNRAIHVVDPWPPASANTTIEVSGRRVADAIERYHLRTNGGPTGDVVVFVPPPPGPGVTAAP